MTNLSCVWSFLPILVILLVTPSSGQIINLITGLVDSNNWLEVGFVTLSKTETVTVAAAESIFDPVIILSAPFAAVVSSDVNTIPLQARVVDFVHDTYMVTFSITLVWPSNTTCVSNWYDTNTLDGSYTVGWYIGESGAYSIGGVQMEFTSMYANALQFNLHTWPYPFGTTCNYPAKEGDDDNTPGGIFTIQSNNNAGLFLNIHAGKWFKDRVTECTYAWMGGRLKLALHDYDSSANVVNVNDIQDEKIGILLFEVSAPQSLDCVVGTYMEIGELSNLDNVPYVLNTYEKIDTQPSASKVAVFGSVTSYNGGDGISVSAYSLPSAVYDITVLLQEDQCMDQETNHPYEHFSYIIATIHSDGRCSQDTDEVTVGTDFTYVPTPAPTKRPSPAPTNPPSEAPSKQPTSDLGGDAEGRVARRKSSLYLMVFLPICLIVVLVMVGYVSRHYLLGPVCATEESSEHGLLAVSTGGSSVGSAGGVEV